MSKPKPPQWIDRALVFGPFLVLCLSDMHFQRVLIEIDVAPGDRPMWLDPTSEACVHRFTTSDHARIAVVCLDDRTMAPLQVSTILLHEAVHVWQRHCEYIGETKPRIEIEAYAIENITRGLMLEYCRQRSYPTCGVVTIGRSDPKIKRVKR